MYGGYERGVLGWKQEDEDVDEEQKQMLLYFEGMIQQWAGQFELTAFVDVHADHVTIKIRESGKSMVIHQADIFNGVTDARKVVVGLSGRTDLD